jgi:hypothetical protein
MKWPPKRKRRLCGPALETALTLPLLYRAGRLVQAPFDGVFWFIEEKLGCLQDRIANREAGKQ